MILNRLTFVLLAQDLDLTLHRGDSRRITVLDRVEDIEERKAFQVFYRAEDPVAIRSRVSEFLKQYSASWLLARVYKAGSRASFGLSDFPTGLLSLLQNSRPNSEPYKTKYF